MKAKVALFANGSVGLEICKFLISNGDEIGLLYIHNEDKQKLTDEIIKASGCNSKNIIIAKDTYTEENINRLKEYNPDFIICVYWAYLLKPTIFDLAKNYTINFHPALLPLNRGWFPHVHSIIDGTPHGVTIHRIDEGADTGDIIVQKKVDILPYETSKDVYLKSENEIINLFKNNWEKIKKGEIKLQKQDHSKAIYHSPSEVDDYNEIDLNKSYTGKDLINILRARSFGEKGFAYFIDNNGNKTYINIKFSHD